MKNKGNKNTYISKFQEEISKYIRPAAGVEIQLYDSNDGGGVIKATLNGSGYRRSSIAGNFSKLNEAVTSSGQRAFGGDLSNVNFTGTNTIVDGNTIFLIKSPSSTEWSAKKAIKDVEGIVLGGKK